MACLIASAAYLGAEFTAEFGALPPSFLPIGNKRLYELQRASLSADQETIYLSLPDSFPIPAIDQALLDRLNIVVLRVPEGLSLGASISHCIKAMGSQQAPLRILHGDTLIQDIDVEASDAVSVARTAEYYRWAECVIDSRGLLRFIEGLQGGCRPRKILCGYFSFSHPEHLLSAIAAENHDFIGGVNRYADEHPLKQIETSSWHDLGHVQLYFQSRARLTTERAFNDLVGTPRYIDKSSADRQKICAEAHWYERVPSDISAFAPKFLGRISCAGDKTAYRLEHLYLLPLSELLVFGRLPPFVWANILMRCEEFLTLARSHRPETAPDVSTEKYREHMQTRLEQFARQTGMRLDRSCSFNGRVLPSIQEIVDRIVAEISDPTPYDIGIWHGDFCLSNMLFDFRSNQLRLIDPRGMLFDGTVSIYGDTRYDLAKLAHSIIGRYDFIMCGRYTLKEDGALSFALELPVDALHMSIQSEFERLLLPQRTKLARSVRAMMTGLFFSMLPLHNDQPERQKALLANGLRLFNEFSG